MTHESNDRGLSSPDAAAGFQAQIADEGFQFRGFPFDDRKVTGAQIAEAFGAHPITEFVVLHQLESRELETLRPTELADLSKRVRFFVIRGDATYRFFVDGLAMEWPKKTIGGRAVKDLAGKSGEAFELLLERADDADKVIGDEDDVRIAIDGVEKFATRPPKTHVTIIVNGRPKEWGAKQISFEEVVLLAYPTPPDGQNIVYTVTFHMGPPQKPEGSLTAGHATKVQDKMVFNVRYTDKS